MRSTLDTVMCRASASALVEVGFERGLDSVEDVIERIAETDDFRAEPVDRHGKASSPLSVRQALSRFRDEQSQSLPSEEPAFAGQLIVCLGNCLGIDRELFSQSAHAWKLGANGQLAARDRHLDSVGDLTGDRARGGGAD